MVGSQYRRRFGISTSNGDEFTYLIEGIGSTKGLLEPIRHEIEHFTSLVCFKQDNNTLYPDTAYNCLIYTAIENNTQNNGFQIRPNPVNDEAELITTSDAIKATLVLFNYLGEQVLICNNVINGSKINFTSLPSGMYFYYILNFDGKIFKGKLLIK